MPIWIIFDPRSSQQMAYIMDLPSAVFGVMSWHMERALFSSMGLKKAICSPESKEYP